MKLGNRNSFKHFLIIYIVLFSIAYIFIPYVFILEMYVRETLQLSLIILLSFITIYIADAVWVPMHTLKIRISFFDFSFCVFSFFLLSIMVTFITAPKIPIIESLRGASKEELSLYRELFLKARSGWESSLAYVNGVLTGAVIPFIIALAFERESRYRFLFLLIFFIYSISFLEKAYFLKVLIPLIVVYFYKSKNKKLFTFLSLTTMFFFLVSMALLSGISGEKNVLFDPDLFFSVQYASNGPFDMIIWRGVVIPVVTALDGLKVFIDDFGSNFFWGATSSFLSLFTGVERVNFERELFFSQWGQNETETGNANALYLLEAYINFGYTGVIFFSFIVGIVIKLFSFNKYLSTKGMILLFFFNIFNAGLIGTLLSNGFLFLILIVSYVEFD